MNDEQPISFIGTTGSNSTTKKVEEFDEPGVITRTKCVTHQGQQYALQQKATLVRNGSPTTLWRPLDKEFIAGNGQVYDLPMRFEFSEGDKLILEAENVNQGGNEYHHNMTVNIDLETGIVDRLAAALRRAL